MLKLELNSALNSIPKFNSFSIYLFHIDFIMDDNTSSSESSTPKQIPSRHNRLLSSSSSSLPSGTNSGSNSVPNSNSNSNHSLSVQSQPASFGTFRNGTSLSQGSRRVTTELENHVDDEKDDKIEAPNGKDLSTQPSSSVSTLSQSSPAKTDSQAAQPQSQPPSLSRTQQKLFLQRDQTLSDASSSSPYNQNMSKHQLKLMKELDRIGKEYWSLRRFEDPLKECFKRVDGVNQDDQSQN